MFKGLLINIKISDLTSIVFYDYYWVIILSIIIGLFIDVI